MTALSIGSSGVRLTRNPLRSRSMMALRVTLTLIFVEAARSRVIASPSLSGPDVSRRVNCIALPKSCTSESRLMRSAARKCEATAERATRGSNGRIRIVDCYQVLLCDESTKRGLLHLFNWLLHSSVP
jgi:hypothetical protein